MSRLWLAWQTEPGAVAVVGVAKRLSATNAPLPLIEVAVTHSSLAGGGTTNDQFIVNAPPAPPLSETRILTVWFVSTIDSAEAGPEHGVPVASSLQASSVPPQAS